MFEKNIFCLISDTFFYNLFINTREKHAKVMYFLREKHAEIVVEILGNLLGARGRRRPLAVYAGRSRPAPLTPAPVPVAYALAGAEAVPGS